MNDHHNLSPLPPLGDGFDVIASKLLSTDVFIIKDEVFVFVSIITVNSLIRSILDYTISITIAFVTIVIIATFVLLVHALIVFIFHRSSIVHKS